MRIHTLRDFPHGSCTHTDSAHSTSWWVFSKTLSCGFEWVVWSEFVWEKKKTSEDTNHVFFIQVLFLELPMPPNTSHVDAAQSRSPPRVLKTHLPARYLRRNLDKGDDGPKVSWWRHQVETFSALLAICAGNSPVTGEFPAQRPVARGFVFFDLRMHKRLGNQWWNRWFETPWPHYDVNIMMTRANAVTSKWAR